MPSLLPEDAPQQMKDFLTRIVSRYPEAKEVWLFGSRVNGEARKDSDWDVLIVGNTDLLETLANCPERPPPGLDLMVVYNGNDFRSPWPRPDGCVNSGSLQRWYWQRQGNDTAHYKAVKFISEKEGLRKRTERAIKLDLLAP